MGLSLYYIPRSQITPPGAKHRDFIQTAKVDLWNWGWDFHSTQNTPHDVTHINTSQIPKIWSLELENTRRLWKILREFEKISKY